MLRLIQKRKPKKKIGFVSQNVLEAIKDTGIDNLVSIDEHTNDEEDPDFVPNCQSISYTHMCCILWSVVKNQQKRIDRLERLKLNVNV